MLPDKFIFFDTEQNTRDAQSHATRWSRPGDHREVIQLAAAEIIRPEYIVQRSYMQLTKPVLNPLSDHIVELTGITRERMDTEGVDLGSALEEFRKFCRGLPVFSFGDDYAVIAANCELRGIFCPLMRTRFSDIRPILKPILHDLGVAIDDYSSGTLLEAFGKTFRPAHDAENDVANLAIALQEMHYRGRL